MYKFKYMKKFYLALAFFGLLIFTPNKLLAATNNVTLTDVYFKEVVSMEPNAMGFKSFKAGFGQAVFMIYFHGSQTKLTGTPTGMKAVEDWHNGDQVTIIGELFGVHDGLITIRANEVKFNSRNVTLERQEMVVENLDKSSADNHKLIISGKEGNKYVVKTIEHFGQAGGPRIIGGTGSDVFVPGTTIQTVSVKRKVNNVFVARLIEVKKVNKALSASKRLLDVVKESGNGNYALNPVLTNPVAVVRKNQLVVQNSGGGLIYLKNTESLRRFLNLPSADKYFLVSSSKTQIFSIKSNANINEQVDLEFYTGTYVSGQLNSPQLVLTVPVIVKN